MVLGLAKRSQSQTLKRTAVRSLPDVNELVVFCPGCKTLVTLWFNNSGLMPSRKFIQQGEQVFHDCGTPEPCRLYRPC